MTEAFTRVFVAGEAIPKLPTIRFFTCLNLTGNAILGLETVVTSATRTGIPVSIVRPTKAAVHPTWGDEFRRYRD